MHKNSAENTSRCTESGSHQQMTNPEAFITRRSCNPRFSITPETLGINLRADTPTPTIEQTQEEPPLVDVKSYYERHNKKPMAGLLADNQQESNVSLQSSHSNTPTNSYVCIMAENVSQRVASYNVKTPSPNVSPQTPAQQWNFDNSALQQQSNTYTSSASLCPTQYVQQNIKYSAGSNTSMPSASRTLQTLTSSGEHPFSKNDTSHTQYAYLQNVRSLSKISQQQQQQYDSGMDICKDDSTKKNFNILNDVYSKRIEQIDANAYGDKDLKIKTYEEWVQMLKNINESFIINMEELQREIAERLEMVQRKANSNCRHSQGNELMKCRKDIDTLLKYIKNARYYNNWDLQGFTFETIAPSELFDMGDFENLTIEDNNGDATKNCNDAEVLQRNKLYANMKALAHEVAEKHDEVRELKRQVICLEDEIQKAQKKIQLKDDVIKELRNDLKCANNKFSTQNSVDASFTMPPINFDHQNSRSANTQIDCNTPTFQDDNGFQFDSLGITVLEEQQKLKVLEDEINDFFEMNKELDKQKTEIHRRRLKDIFQKQESEKAAAYSKLDFIRRQLIDLESDFSESNNDCDSGFHSKSENDHDAKIIDAVRKRLRKLNVTNGELRKRLQLLELENSELSNNLHSEKAFSQRHSDTLKEIANLLCDMNGKQFSYTNIYNANPNEVNPFCQTIVEMKEGFKEKEAQLLNVVGIKNNQIEELKQTLMKNEKGFNEERAIRCNLEGINKNLTTQTTTLSAQQTQQSVSTIRTRSSSTVTTTLATVLADQQLDTATMAASP